MLHPVLSVVHTPTQFAALVGVGPDTVLSWIKKRHLTAFKLIGRYDISDTELSKIVIRLPARKPTVTVSADALADSLRTAHGAD
jgi:hypothetical protein